MLNKVVLRTWLGHLGCFSACAIIIDISANLGANACAAVWEKKGGEGLLALKESQSQDKNATTDGQSLNQTQHSLIS